MPQEKSFIPIQSDDYSTHSFLYICWYMLVRSLTVLVRSLAMLVKSLTELSPYNLFVFLGCIFFPTS